MAQDIRVALTLDNKQFNKALAQSERQTKSFSGTAKKEVNGLTKAFGALAAAVGIKEVLTLADDFTVLNNRLKAVTNSEQEAASALKLVQDVAKATRSDLASVASLFADITIAGEELALSQKDVAQVTQTFSQALKVSGADAGTAAGAIRQFGQALASGVLRGDEFNSINEANSKFMGELAKQLGVTRGELRELAKQGQITADVMIDATLAMRENVEDAFLKTNVTIGESFTQLRNSVLGLFGAVGETGVFTTLASAISALASSIDVLANAGEGLGTLVKILSAIAINVMLLGRVGTATAGIFSKFGGVLKGVATSILAAFTGLFGVLTGGFGKISGVLLTTGNLVKNFGMLFTLAFKNILSVPGILGRAFVTLATTLVAVFGKIAAGAFLALRALSPYTLILYAIAEAVNFLTKKFLDFDLFGWLADKAKGAYEILKKLLRTIGLMAEEEPIEIIDPKTVGVIDDINKQLQEQLDARKFAQEQAEKEKKAYDDFYKGIIDSARETVQQSEFMKQALIDLNKSGLSGSDPEAYAEALKLLTKDAEDFTLTIRDADRDVKNFNDSLSTMLSDMEAENAKLEIFNSLDKEIFDIQRELTLLRDQTLAGLNEALIKVGGEGTDAGKKIVQQMESVKEATDKAIEAQTELATKGYETSRTFETGWNQALETFIEDTTDQAAKAKEVFDTFTKGVEDAFVNFAKTGKLSFKDLLDSMVEMLIRSQIQKLMGSLLNAIPTGGGGGGIGGFFKSIFGLAKGGPAQGGRPYIVGEEGPELFVPKTSGTVVPNGASVGGGTVNNTYITNSISAVDAKSVAQLFAENRKTLLGTVQMAQNEMPYG